MGEGPKVDQARDATFLLTGAGTCVGKSSYLTADPMTIQEGRRAIVQAVSDNRVTVRGPGHPRVNLLAQQPFKFNTLRASPPRDVFIHCSSDDEQRRDQQPRSPLFPSPSPDCGFESDRSSISMASSMSSWSDHSDGSRYSR